MKYALALSLLFFAGCDAVGPDYKSPETSMPASYTAPTQTDAPLSMPVSESADLAQWWKQFQDPELESLIARALAQNPDLQTAVSRVREAREQEIIAGAPGLPQVNANADAARIHSQSSLQQELSAGGSSSSAASGATSGAASGGGTDIKLYSAGFDATWEIDVFGGVRRAVEAADAGSDAALWQMRDAEVTLTAEIAADYASLRATQLRLAILADREASQRSILNLVTAKARAGFVTELDVNQQQQLLAQTVAQRPPLMAQIVTLHHATAVLLGLQPSALDVELDAVVAMPPIPPRLPIGLPSDLLRARPDIRVAERKLAQATAQVGVATADLYPKFDLLAAISFSSSNLGNLFSAGNLGEVGLGAISWPIFHGGQIHANIAAKDEEQTQAYLAWQKAVLGGLQNVEDALIRYETEQQRNVALDSETATAGQSTALATQQYQAGLVTYTSVLQAQSTQLTAQDDLAQSRASLLDDLVSLYKALGGGWHEGDMPQKTARDNPIFRQ